jgi:hypothetical protein
MLKYKDTLSEKEGVEGHEDGTSREPRILEDEYGCRYDRRL